MKKSPFLHTAVLAAFIINSLVTLPVQAQEIVLPKPGVMVRLSPPLDPPVLKGIKVDANNPFRFEFVLDRGQGSGDSALLKEESERLIKYFLASLTVPERDLWVNLSPYEKDRLIPQDFGATEMGRDLLAQDYILKQVTASLIYPEDEIGRKFWKRVYEKAAEKYKTTNIPVNTFNKVWIVPEKAVVYENAKAGTAYVVESRLKVMLEEDYLSREKNMEKGVAEGGASPAARSKARTDGETRRQDPRLGTLGSEIVREIVIPELTREVNEGKNFAQLRQVYHSLILAAWYKKKIKSSILSQVYADKNKVKGIQIDNPQENQEIYQQYLAAFKKGVYNYIKEDQDPVTLERIPRKYFSGGFDFAMSTQRTRLNSSEILNIVDVAQLSMSDRRGFLGQAARSGLFVLAASLGLAPQEAEATLAVPAGTDRMKFARRASAIYGGLEGLLKNSIANGARDMGYTDIGRNQRVKNKDIVFEHLSNAYRFIQEALRLGGDQEEMYNVARELRLAVKADANDDRLSAVIQAWQGAQRIHLLDESSFNKNKPTVLFVHGIGMGPFPYFNKAFDELRKTSNVAFVVYDFLRPIDELADMINREVRVFQGRYGRIKGYVPFSYGFSVFARAVMRDEQSGGRLYASSAVSALSPMIGGTKKTRILKWTDPTDRIGLRLGLKLIKGVFHPAERDFIDAVLPDGKTQPALNDFISRRMTGERPAVASIDVLLAEKENDIHLDYSNPAYLSLLKANRVKNVRFASNVSAQDQHAYIAAEDEAIASVKKMMGSSSDRAMTGVERLKSLLPESVVATTAAGFSGAFEDRAMSTDRQRQQASLTPAEIRALKQKVVIYPPGMRPEQIRTGSSTPMTADDLLNIVTSIKPGVKDEYQKNRRYYDGLKYSLDYLFRQMFSLTVSQRNVIRDFLKGRGSIRIFDTNMAQGTPDQGVNIGGYFLNDHTTMIHELAHVGESRLRDVFNLLDRYPDTDVSPVMWGFLREMAANQIGFAHWMTDEDVLAETKKSYMSLWNKLLAIEKANPGLFPKALVEMRAAELFDFLEEELVRRAMAPVRKNAQDLIDARIDEAEFKDRFRASAESFDWNGDFIDNLLSMDALILAKRLVEDDLRTLNRQAIAFDERRIDLEQADEAMTAAVKEEGVKSASFDQDLKGGIDLNSDQLDLQVQNSGEAIQFNVSPQMIQQLRASPGFVPVVNSIRPLESLPLFLGINDAPSLNPVA